MLPQPTTLSTGCQGFGSLAFSRLIQSTADKLNKYNNHIELENEYIPLQDGRKLAARIWLPEDTETTPVPAILEYLPYRKRDGTAPRDDSSYPLFAAAGYAGVRVDISGTGESDGDYDDEYSPREHQDGLEVIHWIAQQFWCTGSIGMMGISWGGFNSLQLAALRPAPLKAVIAIGTTVDRYNDDIHYKNGCHLYSNFSWSSTMLCYASRPPDPVLVGDRWREMWKHRLETQPFPLETWLAHQTRDNYWKHGSICEDYAAISIPSLVISGWGDGYINAPPEMAANDQGFTRAINGPWIHKYPHFAWPRPRMDFHAEAIRWWDRWLKETDNDAEQIPAYRAYILENIRPGGERNIDPGHWVAEANWPSENIQAVNFYPSGKGDLSADSTNAQTVSICSPLDCGIACGEFFPLKPDSEMSLDQRIDDGGSLVFETDPLATSIDILGQPRFNASLSIDKPLGNVAVRLIDVHPDGASYRVSWGVINLAHRDSSENPSPMIPGNSEQISIRLNECGYRFLPGHRIRISVSTAYWPMVMPPPEMITADITLGQSTFITLPIRPDDGGIEISEPSDPNPLPDYVCYLEPDHRRSVDRDLQNNMTHYRVYDDTGEYEVDGNGMRTRHTHEECWSIAPDDPLTSTASSTFISYMSRGGWNIRTVSESSLRCDKDNFYLSASVTAWEGDSKFNHRSWKQTIRREFL